MSDQWTLFGFDLRRVGDYIRLGVHQLLWGQEVGVRKRFAPLITVLPQSVASSRDFAAFGLVERPYTQGEPLALIIPNDLSLHKESFLPAVSEFELASVMKYEAMASSPFLDGDTVYGWQILSREDNAINVALVIASKAAILLFASEHEAVSASPQSGLEVWSCNDGDLIQIRGFDEGFREAAYVRGLYRRASRAAILIVGVLLVISLPAMMIQLRASQLEDLATLTELSAGPATEAKNRLVDVEEKLVAAVQFFDGRLYYHDWLNKLAKVTPDSVHLTRLNLEGDRLRVSGFATNAAEYQTLLADTGLVSDLSAPSAFTRDARARERFTLTMRIESGQK